MNPTNIETPASQYFKIQDLGTFIANLVNVALVAASLICLAFLVWGGIDWISSQGDKTKYEEARNKITHALLGLAITAAVWLIWLLVLYFLGIGEVSGGRVILPF